MNRVYVAVVTDSDDLEVRAVLGPYETPDDALEAGDAATQYLEDEILPGHARIHAHEHEVVEVQTYEGFILRIDKWRSRNGQEA